MKMAELNWENWFVHQTPPDMSLPGESRYRLVDECEFSPPLDTGIKDIVLALRAARVETFTSCEGGEGHAFPEPTVRFHGGRSEGFRAFAIAEESGFVVDELRRVWPVFDGEPTGPFWEMTFVKMEEESDCETVEVGAEPLINHPPIPPDFPKWRYYV